MTISRFTRTQLLLSIIPAFVGGCLAAVSRGWHANLGNIPFGRSAPVLGFATVILGPISWYLQGTFHHPLLATLVTILLLLMILAHSVLATPLARHVTRGGVILWWASGLLSLSAALLHRAA
jgi:hypothetical protein